MKKIIAFLMILCCLAPVFAATQVGANVGLKLGSVNYDGTDVKTNTTSLIVDVAGTTFFTDEMGIAYGVGIDQALSVKTGDTKVEVKNYPFSLSYGAYAQFAYRLGLSDEFNLDLAAGAGFNFSSKTVGELIKTTASITTINLVADVSAVYAITDTISLIGGVGIDCPIYQTYKVKVGDASATGEGKGVFDFLLTAKVGAAYNF